MALSLLYVRAHGLVRTGAMRSLAAIFARERPDVAAVCEVDSGDALSLATRFALHWAYRGRQALFWNGGFTAREVHGRYLPFNPARPFDRRGLVRVDAVRSGRTCMLATTQFAQVRESRIPELRYMRAALRGATHDAIVFAQLDERHVAFGDLGFREPDANADDERIYVRGFQDDLLRATFARV